MLSRPKRFKRITTARIIDGRREQPIERGAVLVDGTTIRQVGPEAEVKPPDGADVDEYQYDEGTLLPGLIDAHTHLNYQGDGAHTDDVMQLSDELLLLRSVAAAGTHLRSGVTTVRENGAKNRTALAMRDGIGRGLIRGPRILACGRPVTITGGHMWQMGSEADGADGVRKAVRQLIKEGADWIKVPATGGSTSTSHRYRLAYTPAELEAIVDEAHRFGKAVATHCLATSGIIASLDADVDMLIHARMKEADGSWRNQPEVAERIAREGKSVNPTLHVTRALVWALQRIASEARSGELDECKAAAASAEEEFERRLEATQRLLEAGVRLVPGSDAGFDWYPFGQFWRELECFTLIGMTPMEAIISATRGAADAIGVSDAVGTIEPGKEADLLVVNGDPTIDIAALSQVDAVFKAGAMVT